ncbi:MAG: hypothetical protein AAGK05_05060 [Pseudomonadota bacterium]
MSFYHVLSSSVNVDAFPQNHASKFSTPIHNPYDLEGNWEVALINFTHSNCLNTFANEMLTVEEKNLSNDQLQRINRPYTVKLAAPPRGNRESLRQHVKGVNEKLKGFVRFDIDKDYFSTYVIENKNFAFILSNDMRNNLKIYSDVLTHEDDAKSAYFKFNKTTDIHPTKGVWWITLIPLHLLQSKKIVLKEKQEKMTVQQFHDKFNSLIPKEIAYSFPSPKNKWFINIKKTSRNKYLLLLNEHAQHACGFRQRGVYNEPKLFFRYSNFKHHLWHEWSVTIHDLGQVTDFMEKLIRPIPLMNRQFLNEEELCHFLNVTVRNDEIQFQCKGKMQLSIKSDDLQVSLDDDLRDILGFDKNVFAKKGVYNAITEPSLTRGVNYFYIYSSIGDSVRIGNTQAPLLAVTSFNPKPCRIVSDKSFRVPMYVPVSYKHIAQIDIGIYDGAGKLIPFHEKAVTTMRLHFRKRQ